jgi:light-regulated signal transduction histidine kinase (bacteriophytochrome)
LITNVGEGIAPIKPARNSKTGKIWDLSDSRLRSVAPIHIEYLKNMGVEGSMSFAVVVNGSLWGLIACHHLQAFHMTNEKRSVCSTIADIVASQAALMETLDAHLNKSVFESRLKKIIEVALSAKDPLLDLLKQHKLLMEAYNCTGAAVLSPESSEIAGLVPPPSMLRSLYPIIIARMKEIDRRVISMEDIRDLMPDWTAKNIACGLLAIQVGDREHSLFLMFRPELVKMVTWGGDPVKKLESKNFPGQINPRTSFEAWQETVENKSTSWLTFELDGAAFMAEVLFDSALKKKQAIDELTANFKSRGSV